MRSRDRLPLLVRVPSGGWHIAIENLRQIKRFKAVSRYPSLMVAVLYRCPNTGQNVQAWIADRASGTHEETYKSVTCTACGRVHLVNPKSGKTFGSRPTE